MNSLSSTGLVFEIKEPTKFLLKFCFVIHCNITANCRSYYVTQHVQVTRKLQVIYILRNPKDQMVSWLKFLEKIPLGQVEPWKTMISSGWNTYFEHVVKGTLMYKRNPIILSLMYNYTTRLSQILALFKHASLIFLFNSDLKLKYIL